MEPEYFQYLLLMLVSIGKTRPHNLQLVGGLLDDQLAKEILGQQDIGKTKVRTSHFGVLLRALPKASFFLV